jgi:dihydroflavonol-4-reductase
MRPLDELQVERLEGDLTKPETLLPAVQGVDVVFHTAGMNSGGRRHAGQLYTVNVEGTRNVLQAARSANVKRIVVTSSAAALGIPPRISSRSFDSVHAVPKAFRLHEQKSWMGRSDMWPYGYSKYLAEGEVQRVVAQGVDVVIVNPTLVLGAGDYHRRASSIVIQVASGRIPFLLAGGLNVVHIDDVINGHLAALEHGKKGHRYILGGENITHEALVLLIARKAGVDPPTSILPTSLFQLGILPLRLASTFINFPVSSHLLRLAGRYFYYATRKAQTAFQLPSPTPASECVMDTLQWLCDVGALQTVQPENAAENNGTRSAG